MLEEKIEYEAVQHNIASFAIKKYTVIMKDGVEISRSNPMTRSVTPSDDISGYPVEIQGMCNGYWTTEIVKKYNDSVSD